MSESLIKTVFKIIGMLVVALILAFILLGETGQNAMWKTIKSSMEKQWTDSTMDNGARRTMIYEKEFEKMKSKELILR